ncbi:hypothetical protein IJ579_01410 [bacterium]|nr:hypothetical protein [bacterium]
MKLFSECTHSFCYVCYSFLGKSALKYSEVKHQN